MAATAPVHWCWLQLLCVDCRDVLCDCVIGCFLNCWCLPARVLEPLRSGWSGILLPGLSTQLVQPFVHWKKVKALDSCGASFSTNVGNKKRWSLKNKFFDGFLSIREQKNAGFSRRRACWIFRRILQNKISGGLLNIREHKKNRRIFLKEEHAGFSMDRAAHHWLSTNPCCSGSCVGDLQNKILLNGSLCGSWDPWDLALVEIRRRHQRIIRALGQDRKNKILFNSSLASAYL